MQPLSSTKHNSTFVLSCQDAPAPAGDYLETVDNVSSETKTQPAAAPDGQYVLPWEYGAHRPLPGFSHEEINWLQATCDKGKGFFVAAECPDGHRFAKELVCSKDWCRNCGSKGSIAHNRRIARWLPKIMQFQSMGYLVFTLPQELESKFMNKKALTRLGRKVQKMLKGLGFARGLRRWHWFGDRSPRWRPHLNVMVDGGWLTPEVLEEIKGGYADILGVGMADVFYRYLTSPGEMYHTLKYVCRATFLDYEWDTEMAMELHGFRNMVVWGRGLWDRPPVWSKEQLHGKARAELEGFDLAAIQALVEKRCPVCGKPLVWGGALPVALLNMVDKKSLGAGYYRLVDIPPPRAAGRGFYESIECRRRRSGRRG